MTAVNEPVANTGDVVAARADYPMLTMWKDPGVTIVSLPPNSVPGSAGKTSWKG